MKTNSTNKKPLHPHLPDKPGVCVACQVKPGTLLYGITLCTECDENIFIKPYGYQSPPDVPLTAISIKLTKRHPKFDELELYYRFDYWDTLVTGTKGFISKPLVILPGIQPMTQEFLDKLVDKLDLYLTFS